MRKRIALILALALSLALLAAPAFALTLTADQEQVLADYAEKLTDAYAETGVLETVEF